jgi:hypothetical protein
MASLADKRAQLTGERKFFTGAAIAMLIAVLVGFAPSYFLRPFFGAPPGVKPMTPLVHLHGALFLSWIMLFLAQTSLVASGRRDIHRKLGVVGMAMVAALILLGLVSTLTGAVRAAGPPIVPPLSFMAVPFFGLLGFGTLFVAGLANRASPQSHKRLMLLGMTSMMAPAFGRLPSLPPVMGLVILPDIFLAALLIWDLKTLGRPHPATLWGGAILLVTQIAPLLIWESGPWLAFARWATAFVA